MDNKTVVVVGGVAGGMSFATRYRRLNPDANIVVVEKGPFVSFANCGLPYYISGEIEERADLIVASKEMLTERFNLDIRENSEVIKINEESQSIDIKHGEEIYSLSYDSLILSTGASPIKLNIPGSKDNVFTLRNIPDVDKIVNYIENEKPKYALVIGAGFIGLEMAENLKERGLEVSVVEKAPHILPPLDLEMSVFAKNELEKHDIQVYTDTSVVKIEGNKAILEDGVSMDADIIIMSIGVTPETSLAKDVGIELGVRNGIVVNEDYETSIPNIYAVGDAIIVKHFITKEDVMIPLASPANRQGRQLADILSGIPHKNLGSLGTAIVRIFDITIGSTGLNERQLKGTDYQVMHLLGKDHAGYFPGATDIHLKVIYDTNTLQLLGAQGVGNKGIDKRIDVLSTMIKTKGTVLDLQELELSYAPPFGSAKDILNMAGYVAHNKHLGLTNTIQWHEVDNRDQDTVLLDVRTTEEIKESGKIKGSIHIPLNELNEKYTTLDKRKPIIVYCRSGVRSYNAERFLKGKGYDVSNLDGSFSTYMNVRPEGIEHV